MHEIAFSFDRLPRAAMTARGDEHHFFGAQGLPDLGAQGCAAFFAFGPQGLAILPDLGAQGLEPCAAAGTAEAATMPPIAAIAPSVRSDFLRLDILHSPWV